MSANPRTSPPPCRGGDPRIYHVALAADWQAALAAGEYRMSTRGRTLEQEGFVHCSFADQVAGVVERCYADAAPPS